MLDEGRYPKPKVLLVDDAPENIRVLRNLLIEDARLLFATGGTDALATAHSEKPDLILLDVQMPGMDGYEVCIALKSDPQTADVPIIFVTGLGEEDDESRGLELGAIDYITKPFSPAIVRMRVRNHLAMRRVARALQEANTELARLATTDPLTGVANRRRFLEAAAIEMRRMRRYHHPSSLFVIDLDDLKRINDGHGYEAGDRILIEVAAVVRQTLRAYDLLGRLSGESFAGYLPETAAEPALVVAERLRERIAGIRVATADGTCTVTATIAVTGIGEGDTAETALRRAGQALDVAAAGNCVLTV